MTGSVYFSFQKVQRKEREGDGNTHIQCWREYGKTSSDARVGTDTALFVNSSEIYL